ncbi:MAG: alanine--tRNA ligase [Oceanospirillaceae bacterium]|uniref:alanine--tRNA ligase n=3 Tax=unclassified Thalassolituus TaxID=2624967 RepID=UPI000C571D27|nr:alanine--tRNA ligase [Thalassolituus sp. UBA6592]MBL34058.1 alanine--tRNA ligase [Oceanospirillaceae bacterium]MBS52955.1 alanine--tRNA ligase [Oceanospirillaceae bacterium]MBS54478.1 alanine--tRNA ligase [Oceanospirillaceae bacterium]
MKSSDIRKAFLDYFASKGHEVVASSPLIPGNDPTLLFTNAGMVQFKDLFLGLEHRSYTRACTSQRCVRAGGKHNDLENVGYTARHHTFFEMLGNFSFGDYFKNDAIHFAWEFLTSEQWLNLPVEKLMVTVYAEDDEAYDIWNKEIGLPAEKIVRIGDNKGARYASDNFWQMGDTGPCGPCTEIFFDHGEHIWGGPPGSPEEDGDRFIEIWNNVFMQFERKENGDMIPLPKPSVDTGMGLERISAIKQGVHSNYEIDLFQALLKAAGELTGCADTENKSLRVIADHIRSTSFLIVDGVLPSNEGRGYVLRRIIRRAVRHGHMLGAPAGFFHKLVPALSKEMGDAYPELVNLQDHVMKVLRLEEEQFAKTLDKGMSILNEAIAEMTGDTIPGETAFKLYDTFGFPLDLTADVARERDLKVDEAGFDAAMERQREMARSASHFDGNYGKGLTLDGETNFLGYEQLENTGSVKALFKDGEAVDQLNAGDEAVLVLDETAFYAESGGQAGDTGFLKADGVVFQVKDTTKESGNHLHKGVLVEGSVKVGDKLTATVDAEKRQATALHHSATHLLHAALREVLGDHVHQKGSLNTYDRLRFDFSHLEAVSTAELAEIENIVNAQIRANTPVVTRVMNIDEARETGAAAQFGEKYGDVVRVLSMGTDNFSVEFCGGTHASRTGDLGLLKIASESGIAAGIRRIEAVVGQAALNFIAQEEATLNSIARNLKGSADNVGDKVDQLMARNRQLEKELEALKNKLASSAGSDLAANARDINGVKVLAAKLDGADVPALRNTMDQLKNKLGSALIMLASDSDGKVTLLAGVTKDLIGKAKAGDAVKECAPYVDGRGGGKPEMAQAGGQKPEGIADALAAFSKWAESVL